MPDDFHAVEELPISSTSSRPFITLRKQNGFDKLPDGSDDVEMTGVPQLQRHIAALTAQKRAKSYRATLHKVTHLLVSIHLWCAGGLNDAGAQTPPRQDQPRLLRSDLVLLEARMLAAVDGNSRRITAQLQRLGPGFGQAAKKASEEAPAVAGSWSEPTGQGGHRMRWNTYRATARLGGVFGQRRLTRKLPSHMKQNLPPVYDGCANQAGRHMFVRMRSKMLLGIEDRRQRMYDSLFCGLKRDVEGATIAVKSGSSESTERTFQTVHRDFTAALACDVGGRHDASNWKPRKTRRRVLSLTQSAKHVLISGARQCGSGMAELVWAWACRTVEAWSVVQEVIKRSI